MGQASWGLAGKAMAIRHSLPDPFRGPAKELRLSLRSQAVLMSEADHRVKNSLQTLSAMVRLHTRQLDDTTTINVLNGIQRRVNAMATLHGELQTGQGRDEVDVGKYLDRVLELLQGNRTGACQNQLPVGPCDPTIQRGFILGADH